MLRREFIHVTSPGAASFLVGQSGELADEPPALDSRVPSVPPESASAPESVPPQAPPSRRFDNGYGLS